MQSNIFVLPVFLTSRICSMILSDIFASISWSFLLAIVLN
nr:MAG TPA: hypothetical protein [Caudoviricetes sp.]